jgi:Tfp pilus assembly protein PilF
MKAPSQVSCIAVTLIIVLYATMHSAQARKQDLGETPEQLAYRQKIGRDTNQAVQFLHDGRYDEAITLFRSVVERNRYIGQAWEGLAEASAAKGDDKEALKAYRVLFFGRDGKPLNMYATKTDTAMKAVAFFVRVRRMPEARAAYQGVVSGPYFGSLTLGSAYPKLPDFANSDPTPKQLLTMAHLARAIDRLRRSNAVEALPFCDEALAVDQNSAISHYYRGYTLLQLKRPQEANEALRQAIRLARNDEDLKAAAEKIIYVPPRLPPGVRPQ